jgi:phage-related minor tail protein
MARRMGEIAGTQAASVLNEFVGTTKLSAGELQTFAASAIEWEDATGTAIEDIVKEFKKLEKAPLEAFLKLTRACITLRPARSLHGI